MKKAVTSTFLIMLLASSAHATLVGRLKDSGGQYQAYYDDVLNITWLADANLAGRQMTWSAAQGWIAELNSENSGDGHLGVNNWRLPFVVDTGSAGCNSAYNGTDCGYNVQTMSGTTVYSEMAHLFYNTLGNKGYYDVDGVPQADYGLTNIEDFINVQPYYYWSGTEYAPATGYAWDFDFGYGRQNSHLVEINWSYAWAVRPGE